MSHVLPFLVVHVIRMFAIHFGMHLEWICKKNNRIFLLFMNLKVSEEITQKTDKLINQLSQIKNNSVVHFRIWSTY